MSQPQRNQPDPETDDLFKEVVAPWDAPTDPSLHPENWRLPGVQYPDHTPDVWPQIGDDAPTIPPRLPEDADPPQDDGQDSQR